MDPQSNTGRSTDVEFEDARSIGDQVQLSAYQRVTIDDVLNPEPAIPNPNSNTSGVNECLNDERLYIPEGESSATPVVGIGFENVGAMVDDCKNFKNRINSYIGEYDADKVINRLTDKKQYLVDFSFEYSVDEEKRLTGLFWADGLCKRNFMEFGDVISFDATFKTKKYKMVFVPFTGIDNHCRNIALGAGLLASESIDSYKWLLNSFVKSFGRQPKVVVTDQEPAMKQAIEDVFTTSRQRLCMWHIMKKVADKAGHELCNNDDFKRKMYDIVWIDSIEPEEFERQWKLVMIEYGLTQNKWIDDMFVMRSMWILAFYRHEPMSGLMRTTSGSESENHFFASVANSQLTLIEYMNHFDGAMDVQRFNHRKNDHISRYTEPDDWTKTTLEKDAPKIYTRSIFFDQQTEIYGTITECLPMDTKIEGPQIRISLKDFKAHRDGLLEVCFKNLENDRWTKDVVPNELNATFDVKVDAKDEQYKEKQRLRYHPTAENIAYVM
ncbi:protein FAR1-RELATED SEQUENCE 5-like [Helianthus annuus]|uniref:protein FAR1-RELATED SEQUENCE 5-like n=1 Tax=Helianthus annuus TaxID=4232 RepID=UPI000B901B47|nr:protein FAR1-RELATED SEQUENCE 5-like [Helianthus annuus]